MVYFLGRDVAVGLSTEQANYGIKFASGAITITNTSSTSGDLGGAYADPDFIPRRASGVAEVSRITFVSNALDDYKSTATNNHYILIYDTSGKKYLVWYDHDASGVKPTGINEDYEQEVNLNGVTASDADIRAATQTQLGANSDFAAAFTFSATSVHLDITDKDSGFATDIVRGSGYTNSDLTVSTTTEGTGIDDSVNVGDNTELKITDVVGIDLTLGKTDEDIAYFGQKTALKAEVKNEVSLALTRKKSDASFDLLFNKARCGLRATNGSTALSGGTDTIEFDASLTMPTADSSGSGFGYRLYLQLKGGTEVLTLSNMCMTDHSVSLGADAVQEETITFYGNVEPIISTAAVNTTTAESAF